MLSFAACCHHYWAAATRSQPQSSYAAPPILAIPAHPPPTPCFYRLQARVVADLVLLSGVGIQPVMVHGGGPEINSWLNKLGIEAQFKNGLRVTDGRLRALGRQ